VSVKQGSTSNKEQCGVLLERWWLARGRDDSGLVCQEQWGGALTRADSGMNSRRVTFP
jgi:hypothetical protein